MKKILLKKKIEINEKEDSKILKNYLMKN